MNWFFYKITYLWLQIELQSAALPSEPFVNHLKSKHMKKTLLMTSGMLTLASLTACASPKTSTTLMEDDGVERKEIKIDRSYTEVIVRTAIDVEYSNDASQLVITGNAKYLPYVIVKEKGHKLQIYLELPDDMRQNINAGNVQVVLPASKALEAIHLSGACNLSGNEIKAENFQISASGASGVTMDFDIARSLRANISGASSLNGKNIKADQLHLQASGASSVNSGFQIATEVNANVSGASKFNGAIKATEVHMQVSGASHANSALSASIIHLDVSGASRDNSALSAPTVNLKLSGNSSSNTSITAEKVNLSLSGASKTNGNINTQELELLAMSNSKANLKGKADLCNATLTGAAQLSSSSTMLEAQTFHCEASSNSKAHIQCNGKATGSATGASIIYLHGDANNQITTMSAGRVVQK